MARSFERDPLAWLDDAASDSRGVRWMSRRELCVYDAHVARALLRNDDRRMVDHSDFFGNRPTAPPRELQILLARKTLALVHDHAHRIDCGSLVSSLGRQSEWPSAGNALLLRIMRPVLAAPWRSREFQNALDIMVTTRILNRHDRPAGYFLRVRNRLLFYRAVVAEASKESDRQGEPDLLQVIHRHAAGIDEKALVQLYAGLVFATVGSIGFSLGWAVLQALRHNQLDHHPAQIVLEALRLFPVAWLFERRLRQPDSILGEAARPSHSIIISPYAIHRNPLYWDEPTQFLPERWSGNVDRSGWLPFGAGEHGCVAAGLSVGLASRLLAEILSRGADIELTGGGPSLGAAFAPPRFILKMTAPR